MTTPARSSLSFGFGGRISGQYYYGCTIIPGSNGSMATLNKLYAVPFYVGDSCRFDQIAVANVTGVATAVLRVGLYTDNNNRPDRLILDAGTIDISTGTGVKTVSIDIRLQGKAWLCHVPQTALPSSIVRVGAIVDPTISTASPYSSWSGMAYSQTGINGALPASWGSTYTNEATGSTFAAVSMRVK